jgi:alkaline phosphatase D
VHSRLPPESAVKPLLRRTWLQLALAQAATCAAAEPPAATGETGEHIEFTSTPFLLGVASGQPGTRSVVLWTRLMPPNPMRNPWADRSVQVAWQVARDQDFTQLVRQGNTTAPPALAHSVHVEVDGLAPNQVYWYRFVSGGQSSPVGRTRTLPAPDDATTPLKVAFACCQRYHAGNFVVYDHMAADEPDLVVFLGDYIYEMGANVGEARGPGLWPAVRLGDYRLLYELAKSDPALQKMHAACPWLILWDDHEVVNDYAGGEVRLQGATGRLADRIGVGYRAWYEHMPVSPRALTGGVQGLLDNSHALRIHGTHRWGRLVSLHLLDTRQYRSAQASCGLAGLYDPKDCRSLADPARSMLGEAQAGWLDAQLAANGRDQPDAAMWNLLCQPTVFSRFVIPTLGGRLSHDNWDGYPAARRRILDRLTAARTANPVVFSGDVHQNWVAHVHQDPDDPTTPVVAPEFCITSVTTPSFGSFTAEDMRALAPHCVHADRHRRGYALAEITPQAMTVTLRHVDNSSGAARTSARFAVQAGSPTVRPLA